MTDTTDIKALRSEAANIIGLLTAEGHQSFSLDKAADFFDDVFRLLEAERQRSAGSEEELHKALHREKAAERKLLAAHEEIAALKGDQVPVGFIHHLDVAELKAGGDAEIKPHKTADWQIPMFTAPQKPVVLPSEVKELIAHIDDVLDNDAFERIDPKKWNAVTSLIAIGDIEAAGGTVKDGE
ncbi:hypothetical protein QNM34_07875 [Rahnella bonaserana]|uniref:hypothetical protein n=1 Tax=Rahnella bonaserana TaxID=2816248 RepID=UPI0024C216DA|nr:hypothetical protein [Rahnella bonaserana]WHZ42184.1 hypothetical protein QNM34_07875 [Rahnella bonaserana]